MKTSENFLFKHSIHIFKKKKKYISDQVRKNEIWRIKNFSNEKTREFSKNLEWVAKKSVTYLRLKNHPKFPVELAWPALLWLRRIIWKLLQRLKKNLIVKNEKGEKTIWCLVSWKKKISWPREKTEKSRLYFNWFYFVAKK